MGSFASANLYDRILRKSPAHSDDEHIEIIIHNNSRTPDRTRGILYGGEDPFPEILRSARMMDLLMVDYVLIACVTAHYYCDSVQEKLRFSRIFNLLDVVKEYISGKLATISSIGILCTTGVMRTGLWDGKLQEIGMKPLYLPDDLQQELFMDTIYGEDGVKSNGSPERCRTRLIQACRVLEGMGAEAILSSCSELPLVLRQQDLDMPLVDAFDILTDYTLEHFYC
jgi:aspartate racemase